MLINSTKELFKRIPLLRWTFRAVRRALARIALFDWVVWFFPRRTLMFDNVHRVLPRVTSQEVEHWKRIRDGMPEIAAVCEAYTGGDVLDIGCFWGSYGLFLAPRARPGSRFVFVEPGQQEKRHLFINASVLAQLFPSVIVSVVSVPAGDGTPSDVAFPLGKEGHARISGGAPTSSGTLTVKIDSIVETFNLQPDLVKIDVEGAEYFVLSGMEAVLTKHRPSVLLEEHPDMQPSGITVQMVQEILLRHGYRKHGITDRHGLWRAK